MLDCVVIQAEILVSGFSMELRNVGASGEVNKGGSTRATSDATETARVLFVMFPLHPKSPVSGSECLLTTRGITR